MGWLQYSPGQLWGGADVPTSKLPNILNVETTVKCQGAGDKGRMATIYKERISINKKNITSHICEQRTQKARFHTKKPA